MCQFCVCMSHIFFPSRRSSPRRSRSPVRRDRARQSDSRSSYDVLNGQDEIELPEEIIPAWLRCSPADLYFRRNNEVHYARNLSKIERLRGMYNTVHVNLSSLTSNHYTIGISHWWIGQFNLPVFYPLPLTSNPLSFFVTNIYKYVWILDSIYVFQTGCFNATKRMQDLVEKFETDLVQRSARVRESKPPVEIPKYPVMESHHHHHHSGKTRPTSYRAVKVIILNLSTKHFDDLKYRFWSTLYSLDL